MTTFINTPVITSCTVMCFIVSNPMHALILKYIFDSVMISQASRVYWLLKDTVCLTASTVQLGPSTHIWGPWSSFSEAQGEASCLCFTFKLNMPITDILWWTFWSVCVDTNERSIKKILPRLSCNTCGRAGRMRSYFHTHTLLLWAWSPFKARVRQKASTILLRFCHYKH